jgi:hypothetical protein
MYGIVQEVLEYAAHFGEASAPEPDDESLAAGRFTLYENHPNPFSRATVVSYQLPALARTRVDVCNVLGRRVETLFNGWQAGGLHSVRWDAAKRDAGVYFVRLQSGGVTQTRKLLVVR